MQMNDDLYAMLKYLNQEALNQIKSTKKTNNFDVSDLELPSPIKKRNKMLHENIVMEVKRLYKLNLLNKTTVAKHLINQNTRKTSLHVSNDMYKQKLKRNIEKLNTDFEILNKSQIEKKLHEDSYKMEDASLMVALENEWEHDAKILTLKEMIVKWKITIPDKILMEDNKYVKFRSLGTGNVLYYITPTDELLEVHVSL